MTGLIYVAIIAVWAVVLVPAWLRRHDHLDPERSVDRFSRSMQTLASRPSVLGIPLAHHDQVHHAESHEDVEPEVVRPRRPEVAPAALGQVTRVQERVTGMVGQAGARARGTSAAARRRVVLIVLTVALVATGGLVAAQVLLPIALAVPAALLVSFVGVARHQVRTTRQRRTAPAPRVAATRAASAAPTVARPAAGTAGGTWEPRATPLPTYVTKAPAAEFPRVIDTEPGAWTAAAMLKRAEEQKARAERMAQAKAEAIAKARAEQAAAEARSRDEDFLDAQRAAWEPRRRAVNE